MNYNYTPNEITNVRCGVAINPNTPIETLKVLSTDKNYDVRYGVARALLEHFGEDT